MFNHSSYTIFFMGIFVVVVFAATMHVQTPRVFGKSSTAVAAPQPQAVIALTAAIAAPALAAFTAATTQPASPATTGSLTPLKLSSIRLSIDPATFENGSTATQNLEDSFYDIKGLRQKRDGALAAMIKNPLAGGISQVEIGRAASCTSP